MRELVQRQTARERPANCDGNVALFVFFLLSGHDLTLRAGLCSDIITVKGSLLSRLCFFGLIFSHT